MCYWRSEGYVGRLGKASSITDRREGGQVGTPRVSGYKKGGMERIDGFGAAPMREMLGERVACGLGIAGEGELILTG